MTSEDLNRLRFVSDPQLSPDGSQVAYVVTWVDDEDHTRYRSQLMLVPFDGSMPPRALTSGKHRDTAPRWSPDGCSLAFLSDRDGDRSQLFVLPLNGGEARQLTRLKHGAGAPVWSPEGQRIAFSARCDVPAIAAQEGQSDDKAKPPRVKIILRVRHKADGEGFLEAIRRHLFVLSPGHDPTQITDGDWDDSDPSWSPDGTQITFVSSRERDRDLSLLSDIWLVPASGGRARRLTKHKGQAALPTFAPDGRTLAYLGHDRGWTYGARTELRAIELATGETRSISGAFDYDVENNALSDTRDPGAPQRPHWLADASALLAPVSREGRVEVARFSAAGGEPTTVVGGEREIGAFSASRNGRRLACLVSDPAHPYEIYALEDGTDERQLSNHNGAFLDGIDVARVEPFRTTSSDGQTVHGWLMTPPGFSERRKWPVVLEVHGGPETMYGWTFMHEFQVLAARGYAVLYTNPRGSKGYGEAFTARIFADWGNQDAADCTAAVDEVSRMRWVDTSRVGVTGGSYGGFMTSWLVGHTSRFRAAVSQRGCYNFVSFYGTSDIGPWFGDYILGGPVYEREALYRERSPLTYAPAMRTPLLLMHSENDLRCPIEQAEQLFVQLRRLGQVETELIRFPEESHNLSRSGRPDRRIERLERIVGWFDRYMSQSR
jgi:dipeptidyl aminopeptidase/acylaminoacyl peptidase